MKKRLKVFNKISIIFIFILSMSLIVAPIAFGGDFWKNISDESGKYEPPPTPPSVVSPPIINPPDPSNNTETEIHYCTKISGTVSENLAGTGSITSNSSNERKKIKNIYVQLKRGGNFVNGMRTGDNGEYSFSNIAPRNIHP